MGLTPEQRADLRFALYMNADEADYPQTLLMQAASYPNDLGLEVVKQILAALTNLRLTPDEIYNGLNRKNAQGSSAVKLAFANNSDQTAKAILNVVAYLPISKAKKLAFSVEPSGAPIWDSPTADKILRPYHELASRPDAETIFAAYVAHCPQEFLAVAIRAYFTDKVVSPFALNKFDDFYNFANQYIQKTKAKGLFKRNRPLSEAETRSLKEQIDILFASFKSDTAKIVSQLKVIANVNPLICEEFIERLSLHFKNHSPIMPGEYWTAVGRELLERFQENTLHPTGEALGERLDKIYQAIDAYYRLLDLADLEPESVWAFIKHFILILAEESYPTVVAADEQIAAEEVSFTTLSLTDKAQSAEPQERKNSRKTLVFNDVNFRSRFILAKKKPASAEIATQSAQEEAGSAASTYKQLKTVESSPDENEFVTTPSIGFSSIDAWYNLNTQIYGVAASTNTIRTYFKYSGKVSGAPETSSGKTGAMPSAENEKRASSSGTADAYIALFAEELPLGTGSKKSKTKNKAVFFAYESTTDAAKPLRSRKVSEIDAPETSSATFTRVQDGSRVKNIRQKISAAFRHK